MLTILPGLDAETATPRARFWNTMAALRRTLPKRARIALLALLGLSATAAAADPYPWRDHAAPFDFEFGNHFDTHQQTRQARDRRLSGFLYVRYTGVRTSDGYAVATHGDCAVADCRVGWLLSGRPTRATLLYAPTHDHPVFLVHRADIPQPGAHAHFHWLGAMPASGEVDGYLLQLVAVDRFCFVHHGADTAASSVSCRDNGGIAVRPGLDIATHVNIVTSAPGAM